MRTLVIQLGRIGDVIQSTPMLRELGASAEGGVDVLVVHPNQSALEGLEGIAAVHTVKAEARELDDQIAKGFASGNVPEEARWFLKKLDLPRYKRVINASHSALGCWLAGHIECSQVEGGVIGDTGECLYEGMAHTYRVALLGFREKNWFNLVDLLRCSAGSGAVPEAGARPYLRTAERLNFAVPAGRKVALNVGASEEPRRWPQTHWAMLAEGLTGAGFVPMLVGAPSERALADSVQAQCRCALPAFMETPVDEMARLLTMSELLVSVDTGAVHMAAAVGTPVLSLSGATVYFAETAPWSAGNMILQMRLGTAMESLRLEVVLAAALNRLGKVDGTVLRRALGDHSVEAWETSFLPVGADPLGGITYWPVHERAMGAQELFTRALRHVFAESFCGGRGVSLEYLRERCGVAAASAEVAGMRGIANSLVQSLQQMAATASKCVELSGRQDRAAGNAVVQLAPLLTKAMTALLQRTAQADAGGFQPVMHYLDWRFRMMPKMAPTETFAYHAREYQKAAMMLERAWHLVEEITHR
jgi:ADP-heptose:LPS heptosyltransferase